MIDYIFGLFLIVGVIYGFINGNISAINDSLLSSGSTAIEMIIKMLSATIPSLKTKRMQRAPKTDTPATRSARFAKRQ